MPLRRWPNFSKGTMPRAAATAQPTIGRPRAPRLPAQTLRIAVVGGGGHVGLPLSLVLARHGFRVTAIDRDRNKIEQLKRGELPFQEAGAAELLARAGELQLAFSASHEDVAACDVIILTVGTPLDAHLNPDLTDVHAAIEQIRPFLR